MADPRALVEQEMERAGSPSYSFNDLVHRRARRRRGQRVTAGFVGMGIFVAVVAMVWFASDGGPLDGSRTPVAPGAKGSEPVSAVGAVPDNDYLLDLDTGEMTPLPENIVGTEDLTGGYAVSRDGSKLAYSGPGDNGERQIFVANLDGSGAEQVTSDGQATEPAWSPDGSRIAYIGHLGDDRDNVFVLDLATGSSTQLTYLAYPKGAVNAPSFTPDGESIIYGIYDEGGHPRREVRMIPISGGESVRVVKGSSSVQLSPDGSLLVYGCQVEGGGSGICLANADGTDVRVLIYGPGLGAGGWSPDGTRIAAGLWPSFKVFIVETATGEDSADLAEGTDPVWLDDHTLIVEHTSCFDPRPVEKCQG